MPEDEELLKRTYEIEKENNKLLKKLYRSMWWSRVFRVLYWAVILGLMFGAYYYVQPYVEPLLKAYRELPIH